MSSPHPTAGAHPRADATGTPAPEAPPAGHRRRRRRALLRAWHEFLRDRGVDSAASLTFFTALAALPAALLVVSSATLVDHRGVVADALGSAFGIVLHGDDAAAVRNAVDELLQQGRSPGVAAIALALTLWTGSGYATAFGRVVNTIYGVQEGRWYLIVRGRMLLVSVPLVALAGVVVAAAVGTPTVARRILPSAGGWLVVWDVGRWPLLVLALVALLGLLFRFAPNVRFVQVRWLGLGVGVSLLVAVLLTLGFGVYVSLDGGYSRLYGSLGLVLAALVWAYLLNLALVIGAQIDAEAIRMRQLDRGQDAVETIRVPVKSTARQQRLADHRAGDTAFATRVRDYARRHGRAPE